MLLRGKMNHRFKTPSFFMVFIKQRLLPIQNFELGLQLWRLGWRYEREVLENQQERMAIILTLSPPLRAASLTSK